MLSAFSIFPISFWIVIALLIGGGFWSWQRTRDGIGLPMLAVLGTVGFWYVGDAYYNDYAENHAKLFDASVLNGAWWQVAWFLTVFLFATPSVHQWLNARQLHCTSGVLHMFQHGIKRDDFQKQLTLLLKVCGSIWTILTIIALLRLKGEILYYFFPFLGHKPEPWGRGRLGTGFDSLLSVAYYLSQMVAATFGVVAALSTRRSTRLIALAGCLISWPFFLLDRARNSILSIVLPGILSWVLLRLRGGVLKKSLVLGFCFLLINAWMAFVIANRTDMTIAAALREKGFSLTNKEKTRHEGLNMYEELCWISTFLNRGDYSVNWGARYFADLVNPIPRVIWPGKPMPGIDYAIARGQGGADLETTGGAFATISTGLIGQGVVNFGRFLGPAAAALLMAFWVSVLARLDLHIQKLGHLPLYATGLFVTFNVGRDFCFIAVYPFFFGCLAIWWLDRFILQSNQARKQGVLPPRPPTGRMPKNRRVRRLAPKAVRTSGNIIRPKHT